MNVNNLKKWGVEGYSEVNSFNALRFFFCVIVIIGHCLDISHTEFAFRNFVDMHISVCAFFILSGYWVTKSYLKNKSIKTFYAKRAFRILPLYFLSVFGFAFFFLYFLVICLRLGILLAIDFGSIFSGIR